MVTAKHNGADVKRNGANVKRNGANVKRNGAGIRAESKAQRLERLKGLDPERDAEEIHYTTVCFDFPWDYQRALEFALFRTYCVPSIADVLVQSDQFRREPQKRYDDTSLLMVLPLEHGLDSRRGKDALKVINAQHARYDITNDDMLYVLGAFIFEPLEWIDRFGWRRLLPVEREAAFHYYRAFGRRLGIRDIPETMGEFRGWYDAYEERNFRANPSSAVIGKYTVDLYCSWFPGFLAPVVKRSVESLIGPSMTRCFGFRRANPVLREALELGLRIRGMALRPTPSRKKSKFPHTAANTLTYPGFDDDSNVLAMGAVPLREGAVVGGRGCPVH
ncbi:oxygenase MpaB family protein [Corynebacterium hansenii]|uniref:Oxygenase MpaB family protein n=1 Tax=Corynebacterium hansenii TaxID=394964 RepID=A0ABV7ZNV7_9CORY|nr:oxygenase MpaB family protein [Corynebacterium hansenii]